MTPYKMTAEFDEHSLPQALRRDHGTKAGTWGLIRILSGELRLIFADGRSLLLSPGSPGVVAPEERHRVQPSGPFRMQIEFHHARPIP